MHDETPEWMKKHASDDRNNFHTLGLRLEVVEKAVKDIPKKSDMETIVEDTMIKFFTSKGLMGKNILVTTAIIVGALVVIGGGAKWLLGIIGFSYIK